MEMKVPPLRQFFLRLSFELLELVGIWVYSLVDKCLDCIRTIEF